MKFILSFLSVIFPLSAVLCAAEVLPPNEEKLAQIKEGTITEAYASWWGYNTEDTTEILQTAIDSGVQVLHIDKMEEPWIVRPLFVHSNIEMILEEDVTLLAKEGEFKNVGDALLSIVGSHVTVRGGRNSMLLMRKKDYQNPPYILSEWRHAIHLYGAKDVRLENLILRSSGGDGVYMGAGQEGRPCENIVARNLYCDDNNRQGITLITGRNILIENCLCVNTSGLAPEAGIDIEPNRSNQCLVNCVVRNCVFAGNAGDGIELYLPNLDASSEPISILIENCISQWNGRNGLSHMIGNGDTLSVYGEITLRNIDIRNNKFAVELASKGIDAHSLTMENITMDCSINRDPNTSPITLYTWLSDQYPMGNMVWKNFTIIDPMGRKPINYIDRTPFNYGLFDITGSLTQKKSVDDPGTTETIDDAWLAKRFPGSRQCGFLPIEPKTDTIVPAQTNLAPVAEPSELISRNDGKWYLYGTKGEVMKFSLKQRRHNPTYFMKEKITPHLHSPSGKEILLEPFTTDATPYEVMATETGVWELKARSDEHDLILCDCEVPNGAHCYSQGTFATTNATYYFAVPEKTEQFALNFLQFDKEEGSITVIDPNGKECWTTNDSINGSVLFDTKESVVPGVWTIKMKKGTDKLNDFFITIYGIAGFLTNEPDKALVQPQ